jgi:hypothetical protein
MKFFCIRNRIRDGKSVDRRKFQLIGFSTKRDHVDDNSTIGYKGSGKKLAAVAAIRLGISTGIASNDEAGGYFLEFDTEEILVDDVVSYQVYCHYYLKERDEAGALKRVRFPTDRVLEAFPDWDKPIGTDKMKTFKLLREHVCDAYDEDKEFEWCECDERTFARKGEVAVFLGQSEEYGAILAKSERYFKFLSPYKPHAVIDGIGEIWPKSETGTTRLFLLGVLVDCDDSALRATLFDYSLYDKKLLSEERILKNAGEFTVGIGRMFASLADVNVCRAVIRGILEEKCKLEEQALGMIIRLSDKAKVAWRKAVHDVLGEKIALPSLSDSINSDAMQMYGHTVIRTGGSDFRRFLKLLGVLKADEVFPKNTEDRVTAIRFEDLAEESRKRFETAFAILARHFPDRAGYPIYFFKPRDEATKKFLGFAGCGDHAFKEVWVQVETDTALPSILELLLTLAHESRHCQTKKNDYERGFIDAADQDVVREILRQHGSTMHTEGKPIPSPEVGANIKPTFGATLDGKAVRNPPPAPTLEIVCEEAEPEETHDDAQRALDEVFKMLEEKK